MQRVFIAVAILVAVALTTGWILQPSRDARADDAFHITSLGFGTDTFDPAVGPEAAVVATLTGQGANDYTWNIDFFYTLTGTTTEQFYAYGQDDLSDGFGGNLTTAVPLNSFPSGTTVRAQYETRDATGLVLFSFSRNLPIP